VIVLAATVIGWALAVPVGQGRYAGDTVAIVILVTVAIGLVAAAIFAGRSFRNLRRIAKRVEDRFPSLDQRLLTAIELADVESAGGPAPSLGYLQSRVIEEANSHSRSHRWADVVSPRQVWLSRSVGVVSLVAMAGTLWVLAFGRPAGRRPDSVALGMLTPALRISVEPGDTEVERGTGMTVTVRFSRSEDVDDQTELVCISEDGSERRYPMRQTLSDPVVSAFISSVDAPLRYQVVSPRVKTGFYSVDVFDFPSLVRADAELEFPAFTEMPTKRIEDTLRVTMVEGTRLRWELSLNRPVAAATLVDADGGRIELGADAENRTRYRAEFEMARSQSWRLELVDASGRQNKFTTELVARVFANDPPVLKSVAGGDAEVSPLEEFPVVVSVRDDFGLGRFGVSYLFSGGREEDIELGGSVPPGENRRGEYLFDFESLGAKPDQLLTYHFWAEDTDRDGKPRRTRGELQFVEVRPFEEIYRESRSAGAGSDRLSERPDKGGGNGQQAEQIAELQKRIISATWQVIRRESGGELTPTFTDDVEAILAAQSEAIGQLDTLGQAVTDDSSAAFVTVAEEAMETSAAGLRDVIAEGSPDTLAAALDAQQAAYQALLGLRAREFEVSRSRQNQSGPASTSRQRRQPQLDQLRLTNDENRYESQSLAETDEARQESDQQREVIDRLRELAQRQEDINKQVAPLQSALELAQNEAERAEAERQLKRLHEQEQELLRDADDLGQQMREQQQRPESADAQPMRQASEQLEQTRENIRQASEALARDDASQALASGTRAERELDQMREELRQQAAGDFGEAMRQMRSDARELDERQQKIASQINDPASPDSPPADTPGLRPETAETDLVDQVRQQRERLGDLLKQVEETVHQAESTEPLLAQKLYDTYRTTQQKQVDRKLGDTAELLSRGMRTQAETVQRETAEAISELRRRLEGAADSVLGDQTRALERAVGELEKLRQQLDGEIVEATAGNDPTEPSRGPGGDGPDDTGAAAERSVEATADAQPRTDGEPDSDQNAEHQMPGEPGPGEPGPGESGQAAESAQSGRGLIDRIAPSNSPQPGQSRTGESRTDRPQTGQSRDDRGGTGGTRGAAPLTGQGYREWSDRLRDVEQMIDDPAMRSEAIRIRERARDVRSEFRRHSTPPQWDDVEQTIARPLRELTRNVAEELLRRSADRDALVPIDRDPVPDRYGDAVRRYYESLGSGR
jgi:hypothetical protein